MFGSTETQAPMSMGPTIRTPSNLANATPSAKTDRSLENCGEAAQSVKGDTPEKAPSGYVISISGKKQLRRLHYCGACYRILGAVYLEFENRGTTLPGEHEYDDYCHQCWRDSRPHNVDYDSVQTGSESSSTEWEGRAMIPVLVVRNGNI